MVPKRLAFVITSLSGGGAERVVMTLCSTLGRMGHEAHLFVLRGRTDYRVPSDVAFSTIPGERSQRLLAFRLQARRLEARVRELELAQDRPFDLFVSNLVIADNVVARCRFANVYHCVHASVEAELRQARSRSRWRYLRESSRFRVLSGRHLITVSRGLQEELESSRFLAPASVRTIYNPLEVGDMQRLAREEVAGLPGGKYVIHVGRAARQKRHDLLFEAFRELPAEYRLVLLAPNPQKLEPLIDRYRLRGRVISPGFQHNPYAWISRAELLVLASDFEGLPLVAIEALACGTPVVATDCPHGPREILTGELSQWLVPVGDSRALAATMNRALSTRIDVSGAEILTRVQPEEVAERYLALASGRPPSQAGAALRQPAVEHQ